MDLKVIKCILQVKPVILTRRDAPYQKGIRRKTYLEILEVSAIDAGQLDHSSMQDNGFQLSMQVSEEPCQTWKLNVTYQNFETTSVGGK